MSGIPGDSGPAEDAALTRSAQAGDVSALALLLERHRSGMRAVAVSLLGPGPDVDDVMQEAALVALRRIVDVRDPEAVGPWLRMVVRNGCRTLLRAARRVEPMESVPLPSDGATPEQILQSHALRDWIWEAVEALSPTLRLPLVLRYFSTGITSYQQIAEACSVPVSTVRSRIEPSTRRPRPGPHRHRGHGARGRDTPYPSQLAGGARDTRGRRARRVRQGGQGPILLRGRVADRRPHGSAASTFCWRGWTGTSQRVCASGLHVVVGRSLVVWEMELINPPDDPDHCPPGVAWIMSLDGGRFDRVSLHHASRPEATPAPAAV